MKLRIANQQIAAIEPQIEVVATYHGGAIIGQTVYPDGSVECWDQTADGGHQVADAIAEERRMAAALWLAQRAAQGAALLSTADRGGYVEVELD